MLPALSEGEQIETRKINPDQHFTEPPPRFSEASLVKRLEELGIGRPSTYASIISVLQDRNYVRVEKKRFFPLVSFTISANPGSNMGSSSRLLEFQDAILDALISTIVTFILGHWLAITAMVGPPT